MKKSFLCICFLSCLSSIQAQKDSTHRHEFWISTTLDYFLERGELQKGGTVPVKIIELPGFRLGLGYNARLFKKKPGYLVVEAYYGLQVHKTGAYFDYNAFSQDFDILDDKSRIFETLVNSVNHYITLLAGYEHRVSLKKAKGIQIIMAAKAGLVFGLTQRREKSGLIIDSTNGTIGKYADNTFSSDIGTSSCPLELSLGLLLPLSKKTKMKVYFSYSHPLVSWRSWEVNYNFYNVYGTQIGKGRYVDLRRYLSIGANIGF